MKGDMLRLPFGGWVYLPGYLCEEYVWSPASEANVGTCNVFPLILPTALGVIRVRTRR